YFCDWSDRQHCHNPNTERWDRSNGRLYRMVFAATHQPRPVDLSALSDRELAALLQHRNAWYPRMAHRLLTERALRNRGLDAAATSVIEDLARKGPTTAARLRGLWTAHTALAADPARWEAALRDPDAFVRAWAVQLIAEDGHPPDPFPAALRHLAQSDPSPRVRLALASAAQRLPANDAWSLLESLARHAEDREDRNLPPLIWTSLAPRMTSDPARALAVADITGMPQLTDWIHWYAAVLGGDPLEKSLGALATRDDPTLRRRLAGLWLATEPKGTVPQPAAWKTLAARLQGSSDPAIVRRSQQLAAAFGDTTAFPELRRTLADRSQPPEARKHAFAVLSRVSDPGSLPVFLDLLEDPAFRVPSIRVLARYDDPRIAAALIGRFSDWEAAERTSALDVLTRRPDRAAALLDAVAANAIARDQLTALHLRQMSDLHSPEVDRRIASAWGRLQATPAETLTRIAVLQRTFEEAPLWAYDGRAGRTHFQRLCASCHVLGPDGQRIGPELTGAGRNGIRYFLENIVDPDAVVGSDFQLTTVETRDGEVVSGLVMQETDSGLSLRTVTEQRVLPKASIARRERSDRSLMPDGLLESLSPREQLELLKYLTGN
ncbi:MAG: HEAT repeat domain-containing protein, partial [Verrucomicrobia bacterium]|nr:HEAT repeat domain-containing protein [Verrucomicrobiota bacterium]